MNCKSCSNEYNLFDRKPCILLLCGHTICQRCAREKLSTKSTTTTKDKRCPHCHEAILSLKPNFAMLDFFECLVKTVSNDATSSNAESQTTPTETTTTFFSANHKHAFESMAQDESNHHLWACEGTRIFGN